jgi:hypothetical protein
MKTFAEIKAGDGIRRDLATIEHLNFKQKRPEIFGPLLTTENSVVASMEALNKSLVSKRDARRWWASGAKAAC